MFLLSRVIHPEVCYSRVSSQIRKFAWCTPLLWLYTAYVSLSINYTVWIINNEFKCAQMSVNGKTPVSLSVLCKIRYQQPADNVYRVLQHAVITFFNVSHSIFQSVFHSIFHFIPHYSFYSFPTILLAIHACRRKATATTLVRPRNELPSCALGSQCADYRRTLCNTLMFFHSALQ